MHSGRLGLRSARVVPVNSPTRTCKAVKERYLYLHRTFPAGKTKSNLLRRTINE